MTHMRARHKDTGAVADVLDNDFYRNAGWEPVDPSTPTSAEEKRRAVNDARRGVLLDQPAAEVVAAVESLPDAEKAAVAAEEKAGKGRKSVVKAAED